MTSPRTVLIVDDDLDTRIVFGTYLRHFGLRVIEATNGEEARRVLQDGAPDVVLFDPTLEELMGGVEALPGAVAVSASILAPGLMARLRARSIPLLQKPCSPVQVLEIVQEIVQGGQGETASHASTSGVTSISEEATPNAS